MARGHRGHHHKKRLPFWKAVSRYGFGSALSYELRKPRRYPRYPIWFIPMLISMVILAFILYYYPIDYLPILFYILELIVVGYLMYRLLKRLNRFRIKGNLLRLWGLKILSALVSVIGVIIIYYVSILFLFTSIEILLNQESLITQIMIFGNEWNTPFVIPFLFIIIGVGLLFIGAYLLFKFKMKTGNVIWVGRF